MSKSTPTFNKAKPFGEIWGETDPKLKGARYVQDGHYFNNDGERLDVDDGGATVKAKSSVETVMVRDDAAVLIAQRRSELMLKALPLLEPGQDKVIAELPDYEDDLLAVMVEVEGASKKRKLVLEALDAELKARAEKAATETGSQVSSQLQA